MLSLIKCYVHIVFQFYYHFNCFVRWVFRENLILFVDIRRMANFEEYTQVNIEGLDCRMGLTVIGSKCASVCATVCSRRD
jgi:hypothetical protein